MGLRSEVEQRRNAQIERRLNELGSMVKGNQDFQADRLADVLEQIAALGERVDAMETRLERIADWINKQREQAG